MFILYAIPVGILAGLLLGGRLHGLSTIQFRWAWVFMLGLAVQLVLFSDFVTERIGEAGVPIYVGSTLAVAAVIAMNLRIQGMPIILLGAVSNLAAIIANGGYMPASADRAMGVRIAVAMTTTTPSPIRMSPTLNTFENGSHSGRAKMSVSQGSAGSGTNELFE